MQEVGRALIAIGIAMAMVGALLYWSPSIPWLGRLPGDLRIERPGARFYFPIATCVVLSLVLTLILNLWSRLR